MGSVGRMVRQAGNWIPASLVRPFGAPAAVFFHGVEPKISDPEIQINQHTLDSFENIARSIKRYFDVLPLSAMADVLKQPLHHRHALFLMSDDGYANTLSIAGEVLAAYALPWTLFVSTHHIDTRDLNPVTEARIFLLKAPDGEYDIPHVGRISLKQNRCDVVARTITTLKSLSSVRVSQSLLAVKTYAAELGIDSKNLFPSEQFLTWDGVRTLHQRGVEIGAHADCHWAMHADQSAEYLREQAMRPKQRIEAEVGACRAFAYPFGQRDDIARTAWESVRDAGYDHAFTTIAGTLSAQSNPWLLPRYGLRQRESNLAAVLPMVRSNNARLQKWQSSIGKN